MNVAKVLGGHWLIDALCQPELLGKGKARHHLQPFQDRRLRHLAAGDQPIAMRPVSVSKHLIGRSGGSKRDVIHRLQPVPHILNVFKSNYEDILPNPPPFQQICGAKT